MLVILTAKRNEIEKIIIELEIGELGEVCAKLANELEYYGEIASSNLISAFKKLMGVDPIYETTLMKKWINLYNGA